MPESALRIYAGYAGTRRLRVPSPTPLPAVAATPCVSLDADPFDSVLIEVLDAPLDGSTIDIAYRNKEARLRELLSTLTAIQARNLHARLAAPTVEDPVAERFARLATDRRARLLAFLAGTRRRIARACEGGRSNG
jgi:hypothetical protein